MLHDTRMKSLPVTKKEIFGWCCFDFANSSFTTIVITAVFPLYFVQTVFASNAAARALSLWAWTLALSQIIVLLISPIVGAFADRHACKKKLLFVTTWICSLATAALALPASGYSLLALVMAANIAFSLGENLCASFLPEISTPETAGRISGYGWSFGYIGGLVSLGIVGLVSRSAYLPFWIAFPLTGLFFLIASAPTFLLLRERAIPHEKRNEPSALDRLQQTLSHLKTHRTLALFFIAFMLLMAGLSVVFAFASIYATQEFHFSMSETILLFASLQISSALGAFIFGFVQDKVGSKKMMLLSLVLWVGVSVLAWSCVTKTAFFCISNLAGLCVGSTQSGSRAVVSLLAPSDRPGEFFGYWGFFGKLGAVLGPFAMGAALAFRLSLRTGMLLNGLFFLAALSIISFLKLVPPPAKARLIHS